jgi:hypothetical protein
MIFSIHTLNPYYHTYTPHFTHYKAVLGTIGIGVTTIFNSVNRSEHWWICLREGSEVGSLGRDNTFSISYLKIIHWVPGSAAALVT